MTFQVENLNAADAFQIVQTRHDNARIVREETRKANKRNRSRLENAKIALFSVCLFNAALAFFLISAFVF